VIGVNVSFQYEDSFDRARVIGVADNERATFEGMPGLQFKFFTFDESGRRANNFYVGIRRRRRGVSSPTRYVSW
jgi:hypothetical protein